jgi:Flp pilus assembly protein TadD
VAPDLVIEHYTIRVQDLEPVAKSDPTSAELHEVLVQSCWWAKNYSCALDEFHKILQQNPDSPAAHMLSREALDGLRRTPEAIVEFQTAAKIAPTEPNVNFGLGYLRWKMRQYDDAKREFEAELVVESRESSSAGLPRRHRNEEKRSRSDFAIA